MTVTLDLSQMTGLEVMQAVKDGVLPPAPIAKILDFTLTEVRTGYCIFEGDLTSDFQNPMGTIHGGYTATLLDSAMACAVMTALPKGASYTSLEIKVNFVRGFTESDGSVRAEGEVIHAGRRTATAEGRLYNQEGKLLAHGSTTCLIFQP